jgi:bleomycin hydrolase
MTDFKEINLESIARYGKDFDNDPTAAMISNALSFNYLSWIAKNRSHIQERNDTFSNEIDPQLEVTNQESSGRCWLFSILNIIRFEIIKKYKLPENFELSQSYLSFWDKFEKCNYFLNTIIESDTINLSDDFIRDLFYDPISDGGYWETGIYLIKKYGLVPKDNFKESSNSSDTDELNNVVGYKLKEFANTLSKINNKNKRYQKKDKMMQVIYNMLCKLFGKPPHPSEQFTWEYTESIELTDILERESKRRRLDDERIFENFMLKKVIKTSPLEFYEKHVPFNCDRYTILGTDPRNKYYEYYTTKGNKYKLYKGYTTGFYNVPMNILTNYVAKSILNNTPVVFHCDVGNFIDMENNVLDTDCFDYDSVFNTSFTKMNRKDCLNTFNSYSTHAMVFTGVDLDNGGKPAKWKVENSWGTYGLNKGYYTMSQKWFERFVYTVVIDHDFLTDKMFENITNGETNPTYLPHYDPMV